MDMKDIYNVGNDIMDAVNDAVTRQDFSGLNETLRSVTGSAAGQAADALHSLQEHLQSDGTAGAASGGERTYGHAGRAGGNVTEEYMKRASGPRHHTTYSSRISPFLQQKISRSSGTGRILGGVACLVFAGISFLDTIASGLLGFFSPVGNGLFSAWSIFSLIIAGGFAILGGILLKSGKERKELVRKYYEYGKAAGTAEYLEISRLAEAVGERRETVLANIEKMISEEMLPAAWFDRQKTTLMLSERMYNEYLRLERERQEQEAEEAKARMEEQQRTGGFAAAAAQGVSADSLPDDLKLRPEDQKLPAEARKIVEEGLLYMGRVREYNRLIADEEMTAKLTQLETTMNRILEQIRKDPSSAPNLRRLMVYYLPTTMKLLEAYVELDRQPMAGENIVSTKQEIREALGTINLAFENLLDSLFQDMAWDISSDISVMKTMMEQDGLTGNQMRRAAASSAAREGVLSEPAREETPSEPAAQPQGAAFSQEYTDGFSEGLAEDDGMPGAAQQGIQLKFGE
ncbi:MAG: 5-bromo-4-chloroindolyl phosphate hydrolysis family protein [Eubacteriales bacterium]|nr:5-bromo-4-chloroindolyl phosphate hydrolysis family protein [Eubacteriales bacterium]